MFFQSVLLVFFALTCYNRSLFKHKIAAMLGSRRSGLCRGGLMTDCFLLAVFLLLAFVFIQRRGYMSKLNSTVDEKKTIEHVVGSAQNRPESKSFDVDERIKKIPDVRTATCKSHAFTDDHQVTIIMVFFDYQFYDLKTTVASLLHNTKHESIREIIVVDDGSTLDYIKEESKSFAEGINMMKLVRMSTRVGSAKARTKAIETSQTETLVFLDTTVIVTLGWLPPLTELLRKEPQSVAVPHYDNINNPISYEYVTTSWELLTTFSWSFTMRTSHDLNVNKRQLSPYIKSPVIRGNAWAIRKQLWQRLGGFDQVMNDPGAESMEFSLRAWMCGATIKILPCSRVGVLNLKDPVKITAPENVRRIVRLWMPAHKDFIYKHIGIPKLMEQSEEVSLNSRLSELGSLGCKNFDWYLKEVIPDIYTPSANAASYGLLRCRSGQCGRVGDDRRLVLGQCKPDLYQLHPKDMIFELRKDGTITVNGKCLTVTPTAYIIIAECVEGESKQIWEYKVNGVMKNSWSKYCAMHVTDPDKKVPTGRQIVMVQECNDNISGMFVEFEFILP